MKRQIFIILALLLAGLPSVADTTTNPQAVVDLLKRVANIDQQQFTTILDTEMGDKETFVISSDNGKPLVKASTMSALTAGINWYLNHYAHVNISWNNLTTDLSSASLPVPSEPEAHIASVDYRYYLNYCTFSYSLSPWTWDRWQKEIDWMALHGINMPLQIIGIDVVWRDFLTTYYGYTKDEADQFIAGPCFQAWFGMNNLEGWGGPNPDWWYERQQDLAKKILTRERELGIEPVLPGFSGMVPHNFTAKTGIATESQGEWCGFQRPYILDPTKDDFTYVARRYYTSLRKVMGSSRYYSMDPFHEGGTISSGKYSEGYAAVYEAMNRYCGTDSKWIIQQWQWAGYQASSLNAVPAGRLLVLDLFSDGQPAFDSYNGYAPQEALYCTIPNFGGRSGFMGRLDKQMTNFFKYKAKYASVNGIGATPEAIEQVPVLYDNLYELPWISEAPSNAQEWLKDYAIARYGDTNSDALAAWEQLRTSALNCTSALQGPHEAVYCARPSLDVYAVSSWGGTDIFYDKQDVINAAYTLLNANINHPNYNYDLLEVSRQALSDYSKSLLAAIKEASSDPESDIFKARRDAFLGLILDIDTMLGTDENFRLGHWTQMARSIADEAQGTTDADRDWLELDNARTLITTWGDYNSSEWGGLRDYSYRAWQGMLSDYYYPRWKYWFDHNMSAPEGGWFYHDWEWAHNLVIDYTQAAKTTAKEVRTYSEKPEGNTHEIVAKTLPKYIVAVTSDNSKKTYAYRTLTTTLSSDMSFTAYRETNFSLPTNLLSAEGFCLKADLNNDGDFDDEGETSTGLSFAIPANAPATLNMRLTNTDGTQINFSVNVADRIDTPRTVSVFSADPKTGTATITGSTATSVTNTNPVSVTATPSTGYRFVQWADEFTTPLSTQNPYIYTSAPDINLWAYFEWHPWQTPEENLQDMGTIESYQQYVNTISASVSNGESTEIYRTTSCPSVLNQQTKAIVVAPGQRVTIKWNGNDGLSYCYLSAYLDSNADGTFNQKIGTRGTAGGQNSNVVSGSLSFTAPRVECTTMVRFRFDSAWRLPESADFSTTRFVYDIPLIVETATAIKDATASVSHHSDQIYTLQGQPVDNPTTPGLYIKDRHVFKVPQLF